MAVDKEMYRRLGETPPDDVDDPPAGDKGDAGGDAGAGDEGAGDAGDDAGVGDEGAGGEGGQQQQQQQAQALSNEELLARLQEINPEIQSLDDLKKKTAPEDEETRKKKKNNAVLSFALKNDLVSRDKYDQYLVDSKKDARQLVYEEYRSKRKAAGVDDDKISRDFARLYFEDADDSDDKDLIAERQADIESQARKIIKKKYPEVFTLEEKYDKHISDTTTQKESDEKKLSLVKTYQTDVNDIFTSAKFSVDIGDKDNPEHVDFVFPSETIETVKKEFLRGDTCSYYIANYDKSVLQDAINLRLQQLSQAKIIAHAAKTYHSKKLEKLKLGRKGIMQPDEVGSEGAAPVQRDEEMYRRLRED